MARAKAGLRRETREIRPDLFPIGKAGTKLR
jgi:hypothetical protein